MHTKKVGFLCLWARNVPPILKKLSRGALIFPILLCISCASYNIASREGRTAETLNDPKQGPSFPSPQCKPISEGLYVVQAGAFKYISYAQAMREKLEDKGYGSYITVSGFDEEKRIFRVLIGRFTNVKQAQRLAKEIRVKENLDVIVALKPPRDKFVVQAGCFTEMAQAKELRKKLADYGHNAYITLSVKGIDKQYNVLLGEFLNRAEAERVSEEIGKKENIQVFVNTI
jgi:cell division septation protein DedD